MIEIPPLALIVYIVSAFALGGGCVNAVNWRTYRKRHRKSVNVSTVSNS